MFFLDMKPRMKNHFRAHQLSVWLRLIPELHRAGMEDVAARHNLFRNHHEAELYDGVVRADPLSRTAATSSGFSPINPGLSGMAISGTGAASSPANNGSGIANLGDVSSGAAVVAAGPTVTPLDVLLTTCATINGYQPHQPYQTVSFLLLYRVSGHSKTLGTLSF